MPPRFIESSRCRCNDDLTNCDRCSAVTCVQFNPVDDGYFISGSLDSKVRIWSVPDRQVVDWSDLDDMVTAACYTPDGQVGPSPMPQSSTFVCQFRAFNLNQKNYIHAVTCKAAIIGSHKGSCRFYKTTGISVHSGLIQSCVQLNS